MFVKTGTALLFLLFSSATLAQSQLFLVGGSWKTCGSYGTSACTDETNWPDSAKQQNSYRVSATALQQLQSLSLWKDSDTVLKAALLNVLQNFAKHHPNQIFAKEQFHDKLKGFAINVGDQSTNASKLLKTLPDHLYYPINDLLEAPSVDASGNFIREQASIEHTRHESSKLIYAGFMAALKKVTPEGQQPVVLISTASGYDVFAATDYYLNIFTQLGAKAIWLPVEATLAKLLDEGKCADLAQARADYVGVYNREAVYPYLAEYQQQFCDAPEQLVSLAQQANGVFFNGGDQSLTWQSFVTAQDKDRPWLAALRDKFNAGQLVISGTSAGTAVQSGKPGTGEAGMITGGTSDGALLAGTEEKAPWIERVDPHATVRPVSYHSKGGLKFFPYGVLDTHFSERGRQLRLAKLVLASDARFGFGVDETTALVATPIDDDNALFEVVGQNGVYIVEQTAQSENSADKISYTSHYLVSGQKFELKQGKLQFPQGAFQPFKPELDEIVSDSDLTQKTEYRDLVEAQIAVAAQRSLSVFSNNQRQFAIALSFTEQSAIATSLSMDNISGYINAHVEARVSQAKE